MKTRSAKSSVSKRLRLALTEVHGSLNGGKPLTLRTVTVRQPKAIKAHQVKAIRAGTGLSQGLFAKLIGTSSVLVENWEQGLSNPKGPADRLLREIERDPKSFVSRYVVRVG